jgi:hypothetical protein
MRMQVRPQVATMRELGGYFYPRTRTRTWHDCQDVRTSHRTLGPCMTDCESSRQTEILRILNSKRRDCGEARRLCLRCRHVNLVDYNV